jgi:hypothetical protein
MLISMEPNVFSHVIRWLLERIEHFPIPLEEALWAYANSMAGPPGHEGFFFPPPSDGGKPQSSGLQVSDHALKAETTVALPSPSVAV